METAFFLKGAGCVVKVLPVVCTYQRPTVILFTFKNKNNNKKGKTLILLRDSKSVL